jgi:cell wall assembly regulator SMI1
MSNLERGSKEKAMSEPVDHLGSMMLIWHWIEAWLQIASPESLAYLYKGATEQQLQAVETALSLPLPNDFKASWSLHNGTAEFFFGGWGFLPLERMLAAYQAERVFQEWPPTSVPFASDGCGGSLCIDLDAHLGEQMGRIIFFDHELGEHVVASDFWSLMSGFVNDLEDGEYEVDASGRLVSDEVSLST